LFYDSSFYCTRLNTLRREVARTPRFSYRFIFLVYGSKDGKKSPKNKYPKRLKQNSPARGRKIFRLWEKVPIGAELVIEKHYLCANYTQFPII
jgi:hypothetical protein